MSDERDESLYFGKDAWWPENGTSEKRPEQGAMMRSDTWLRSRNYKLLDRKDIISGSLMAVCGNGSPDDAVGSRRERRKAYLQEFWVGAVNVGVSLIHFLTFCVPNDNGAGGRVQSIVKPDANADGRGIELSPRPWLGTDWQGVRP